PAVWMHLAYPLAPVVLEAPAARVPPRVALVASEAMGVKAAMGVLSRCPQAAEASPPVPRSQWLLLLVVMEVLAELEAIPAMVLAELEETEVRAAPVATQEK